MAMLHDTHSEENDACTAPEVERKALLLIAAMVGCCHPRVERLTERLRACDQPEQLRQLQGEVLNLLTLSFGFAEAQRRLLALQ